MADSSWLPRKPSRDKTDWEPWRPSCISDHDPATLVYVCIDDVNMANHAHPNPDLDLASLAISPWPDVDARGRLQFAEEEDCQLVSVSVAELHRFLTANGLDRDADRPIQRGEVLALRLVRTPEADTQITEIADYFGGPAIDCTHEFFSRGAEGLGD